MTDEELLLWLRVEDTNLTDFAADRIEALIEESGRRLALARSEGVARVEQFERTEALTEQLAAARQDAKEAEAYAGELEAERKKTYEALLKVTRIHDEVEAKLAKAVEALEPFAKAAETWEPDEGDSGLGARIEHPHHGLERHAEFTFGDLRRARATLAEIKGESHE